MFTRDLLVFDVETTGSDLEKHELIQIGAVLLDKNTLAEKGSYVSFIKPERWDNRSELAMSINKITFEQLEQAPTINEVLAEIEKLAPPTQTLLAAYTSWIDMGFLRQAYFRANRTNPYDYHCFDIWPLAYWYWKQVPREPNPDKPMGFGLSDTAAMLGITEGGFHEALADARISAEVLRRLLKYIDMKPPQV